MDESGFFCPIKKSECKIEKPFLPRPTCFIAIPFGEEWNDTRKTIEEILNENNINIYIADEDITMARDFCAIARLIRTKLQSNHFDVFEIKEWLGHTQIQTTMSYIKDA